MKFGRTWEDLKLETARRVNAKKDYLLDTRHIIMDADENGAMLSLYNDNNNSNILLGVNEVAHRQIGQTVGIPSAYYDKMRTQNPQLLAENVNAWFNTDPKVRMVRTMDGTARAMLSDRYRRFDNEFLLGMIIPILEGMEGSKVESCEVTDERMYLKVVNPRLQGEVSKGDVVQSGILITNSEVGLGSVTIQPLLYRLACLNGMVVQDARVRKYHSGSKTSATEDFVMLQEDTIKAEDTALLLKIRDTVQSVVSEVRFQKLIDTMRGAKEAKIETDNIPKMVELAAPDFGFTQKEGEGILNHLIHSGDLTLYGFGNAVTRYAQDVESYDRSTALETIGYQVITMPRSKWHDLNRIQAIA